MTVLLALLMLAAITLPATFAVWAERRMTGMQHGPYHSHIDQHGRRRPCYQQACSLYDHETEEAA